MIADAPYVKIITSYRVGRDVSTTIMNIGSEPKFPRACYSRKADRLLSRCVAES